MKTLAERLIWARTRKEMSQEELASRVGVSQSTIGNLEAGIRQTARKLPQIANALGVDALWLADGIGQVTPGQVKEREADASALSPDEIVELVALYGKTGKVGRRAILAAARAAAEQDPLPTTSSANHLQLR